MATTNVRTTALSLARELWRFGEPELAKRAFALSPGEVAEAGRIMGAILDAGTADVLWPDGPRKSYYLLGAIALLEGSPRPAARRRRLPEKQLPSHLQATKEQRWAKLSETMGTRRPDYLASGWPALWTQPAIDTVTVFIGSDTELELSRGHGSALGSASRPRRQKALMGPSRRADSRAVAYAPAMRRAVVARTLAGAILGAAFALASVRAGYWWAQDYRATTFIDTYSDGFGADGPYSSSLSITFDANWADILVPAAVAGAVVGLIAGLVLYRLAQRPASLLVGSVALGVVVGLIGVAAAYGWYRYDTSGDGLARRYVDYLPLSRLSDWKGLLLPAAVTGAVLGLVLGVLAFVVARRSARRAARSS